jgi:hypothetical protein
MSNALKIAAATGVASSGGTDPNFSSVSLLLHGDGTNGAQNNTFIDSSSNNFTITRNGNTTQGSRTPFAISGEYIPATHGGSGYFDGTGDYLVTPSDAALAFGTGDFTVEFWFYCTSIATTQTIFTSRIPNTAHLGFSIELFGSKLAVNTNGANYIAGVATLSSNTWYHCALTRTSSGTSMKLFVNGTQDGSTYTTSRDFTNSTVRVGISGSTTEPFFGYISSLRILKGTAQYTANFTPSTTPLTAITNTSLLLNFTNGAIYDHAAKNNLETVGNAQISTSVKQFGTGSMAFDGTGDWLVAPYQSALDLSTGDWTIEGWIYRASGTVDNADTVSVNSNSSTSYAQARIQMVGSGGGGISWRLLVSNSSANGWLSTATGGTWTTGTWYHIAAVRNGSNYNLYVNGTSVHSFTSSANIGLPSTPFTIIGAVHTGGSNPLNGYIDDLRITKGVARYTANFTAPTAAFPNS